jgi:hypothetical protein
VQTRSIEAGLSCRGRLAGVHARQLADLHGVLKLLGGIVNRLLRRAA